MKAKNQKTIIRILRIMVLFVILSMPIQANAADTKLNKTNITMIAGTSYTLELHDAPEDVMWSTSKKSVVKIMNSGQSIEKNTKKVSETTKTSDFLQKSPGLAFVKIKAQKAGTVKITAKAGNRKYICKVKVVASKLSVKKKTLKSGEAFSLKVKGKKISKWKSSNPTVASVNKKGKVTAKKAGTVTITGTIGVSQLKCTVIVKADKWDKLLDKYSGDSSVRQLIFVKYTGGTKAKVLMYNKKGNKWKCILECQGYVGKKGIGKKKEGDKKTPTGVFNLTEAFGIKNNPGTVMPYIKVNKYQYWCSDKKYYNQLIDIRETPHKCRGEHLSDYVPQYNYGMVLDYNSECAYNKGAAIFLHCKGSNPYTLGCIAVSQKNMIKILKNTEQGAKICIYKK